MVDAKQTIQPFDEGLLTEKQSVDQDKGIVRDEREWLNIHTNRAELWRKENHAHGLWHNRVSGFTQCIGGV